jgi:signal transduction histidine kinase
MAAQSTTPLPLLGALEALDEWQRDPTTAAHRLALSEALATVVSAHGIAGAFVEADAPPLPELELGVGSLQRRPSGRTGSSLGEHPLTIGGQQSAGRLWLDGDPEQAHLAARAIELALDAAWSRAEARAQGASLAALDAAVRGIAGVLSVDRVLQLIVDRVRDLVAAEYAALGIVGPFGAIDQFITSGMSDEQRRRIGALPRGRGLLGLIIREDRALRIDDIAGDPRRSGFPPEHPAMSSFLGVPVRSKGQSIGNLYLTNKTSAPAFSESDQRLVEMFALHAGIAIENARLHEEVQRLVVVEERHRISQDLHDSSIQSLYGVALSLEDVPEMMAEEPAEVTVRVDRAIDSIHQTIRDIRNFILGLQPELLDSADLASGIGTLAAEFQVNTVIDLDVRVPSDLADVPPEVAAHVLAMTREGLSNVARHSAATRASIELVRMGGTLRLVIGDNGRGFDSARARERRQHGLTNLQSRAAAMGGSLAIDSEPGVGTRLEATLPMTNAGAEGDEHADGS